MTLKGTIMRKKTKTKWASITPGTLNGNTQNALYLINQHSLLQHRLLLSKIH